MRSPVAPMVPMVGRRGVVYGRYVEFTSFVNGAGCRGERCAAFYCGQDLAISAHQERRDAAVFDVAGRRDG
ncbi:MAG TPA: hypothetical protein VE309_00575, partial [Caulobacteraceae bacterium]|nr:hypothetical protein [Caulobacteraceae bacterium]